MRVNVALIPNKESSAMFAGIARLIGEWFCLRRCIDGKEFVPHATLYQFEIGRCEALEGIKRIVEGLGVSALPLKLMLADHGTGSNNSFDVNLERTPGLDELHRKIVHELAPFRSRNLTRSDAHDDAERRRNINLYGSPSVLGRYRPHVTLGLARNRSDVPRICGKYKNLIPKGCEAIFPRVAVAEADRYGQIYSKKIFALYP